jgi:flagellum-specific ATP synthase
VMPQVVSADHMRLAQRFKQLWSRYQQSRDLISVGAYVPGGDADTDLAIARQPHMVGYLRQGLHDNESMAHSSAQLAAVFNPKPAGQ